jgi:hypothetical protein
MRPDMIHVADQIGGMARVWAQAAAAYYREAREQGLAAPDSIQLALGWQAAMIQSLAFTRPATDGGENAP